MYGFTYTFFYNQTTHKSFTASTLLIQEVNWLRRAALVYYNFDWYYTHAAYLVLQLNHCKFKADVPLRPDIPMLRPGFKTLLLVRVKPLTLYQRRLSCTLFVVDKSL